MPTETLPLDSIEITERQKFKILPRQLNTALGRILVPRQMSVIHGTERFPMTAIAHQIVASAAQAGFRTFYIDSGRNYSAKMIRSFCSERVDKKTVIANIALGLVLSLEDLERLTEYIMLQEDVGIIVIDSLTGVLNLSTAPASKGRQRKLFKTLENLRELVNATRAHLLMTDHSSIDWKTGVRRPGGGNVIAHGVDSVVQVTSLSERDAIRLNIERTPITPCPSGVVIRASHKGLRSLRSS
ncbi:MAG: hypothetical protein ACTSV2_03585 [Candidatus Thorarchaeota archaeon]